MQTVDSQMLHGRWSRSGCGLQRRGTTFTVIGFLAILLLGSSQRGLRQDGRGGLFPGVMILLKRQPTRPIEERIRHSIKLLIIHRRPPHPSPSGCAPN